VAEVGEDIYGKYDGAVKVDLIEGELEPVNTGADPLGEGNLAFLEDSPDLCVQESTAGVYGTANRECVLGPDKINSCSVLCCGRGYYKTTEVRVEEDCRFVYCCEVICEAKTISETLYRCNP